MKDKIEERGEKDGNGYNLIWVNEDYTLDLMGMDLELGKAKGSLAWTKRILGKKYPCFYYNPSIFTIFHRNGKPNKEKILKLVYRFGGILNKN